MTRRQNIRLWGILLGLPLVLITLSQLPLCFVTPVSDFFYDLETVRAILLLTAIYFLPAYGVIYALCHDWRNRAIHALIYTALLVIYAPLVWIVGLYISRQFFADCVRI